MKPGGPSGGNGTEKPSLQGRLGNDSSSLLCSWHVSGTDYYVHRRQPHLVPLQNIGTSATASIPQLTLSHFDPTLACSKALLAPAPACLVFLLVVVR